LSDTSGPDNGDEALGVVLAIFEVHPRERCSPREIGATKQ